MKLLKINNNRGEFSIDGKEYKPMEEITKEDIFKIMQIVMDDEEIEIDKITEEIIIHSPAQKIIYENIFNKISQLKENKQDIIDECEKEYRDAFNKYKE